MAISNEWTEWYLTSSGWIVGKSQLDGGQKSKGDGRPSDAVLGLRYEEVMQGPFSPLQKSKSEIFRSSDAKKINDLLGEYGECPGGIQSAK